MPAPLLGTFVEMKDSDPITSGDWPTQIMHHTFPNKLFKVYSTKTNMT